MNWIPICSLLGCLIINISLGTFYTTGNLVPYIVSYMKNRGNPQVVQEYGPWLTSSFLFGQGIFILIGAKLEGKYNTRISTAIGCIIHCLSTFATAWAINVNWSTLVVIYGFGSGSGCGAAYISNILVAQGWYPNRKGLTTGLMVAGFGIGGLVFSPLQTLYMNPGNIKASEDQTFPVEVYERTPYLFIYMGTMFLVMQTIGLILAVSPPSRKVNLDSTKISRATVVTISDHELLPQYDSFFAVFQTKIFYIVGLIMMMVAPGVTFLNSLGKTYGMLYKHDDFFLAIVQAGTSIANAVGRIVWGILIEKLGFRICYWMKIILFTVLICLFPFSFILSSKLLYAVWMLCLFFGFCATFVLFPVYIEQLFGAHIHGMVYGFLYIFLALSSALTSLAIQLVIGPLTQKKDTHPEENLTVRLYTCITIGALYLLSLIIFLTALPARRIDMAIERKKNEDFARSHSSLVNRVDLLAPLSIRGIGPKLEKQETLDAQQENSLGSIVKFRETPKT